ncbi:MAG: hypothetical protein ACRD9S_17535 [Pyrinomonadaceae bacterium]
MKRDFDKTGEICGRRAVLKSLASAAAGIAVGADRGLSRMFMPAGNEFVSRRPAAVQRRFVSEAVEAKILEVKSAIADPELAWLFENCFPNTRSYCGDWFELSGLNRL